MQRHRQEELQQSEQQQGPQTTLARTRQVSVVGRVREVSASGPYASRLLLFFSCSVPNGGAVEVDGGELNSPRGGEAGSRRQLDDTNVISAAA